MSEHRTSPKKKNKKKRRRARAALTLMVPWLHLVGVMAELVTAVAGLC